MNLSHIGDINATRTPESWVINFIKSIKRRSVKKVKTSERHYGQWEGFRQKEQHEQKWAGEGLRGLSGIRSTGSNWRWGWKNKLKWDPGRMWTNRFKLYPVGHCDPLSNFEFWANKMNHQIQVRKMSLAARCRENG